MKLRVLSYNIHKCIGGVDRRYDPQRIADVINHQHADVLLLQEVDHDAPRSNRDRQVDVLGDIVGMRYRSWFPNVEVRGGGSYGNAILSRYPIVETSNIDLSIRFKKRRSVLHGVLRVRHDELDRTVHVYNMHLGLARFERRIQLLQASSSRIRSRRSITRRRSSSAAISMMSTVGSASCSRPPDFAASIAGRSRSPRGGRSRALDAIFVRGARRLREARALRERSRSPGQRSSPADRRRPPQGRCPLRQLVACNLT